MFQNVGRIGSNPAGFALIIVISLMLLLAVVTIGMLSLATVSVRTTKENEATQEARANARLSLILAIGELQRELGPDQRVSAPGGQKLAADAQYGRKNWIGVYDSWPATSEERPAPVFRKWLISGNSLVTADAGAVASISPLSVETEILVGEIKSNVSADPGLIASSSEAVAAGVVRMENGGHAWWIGDNNMKAKMGDIYSPPTDEQEALAQMQAPPQALLETFLGSDIDRADPRFGRVVSLQTLDLLATPPQPLFHDVTTSAKGLLTNVRSGGFRKDLSFFLQKPFSEVDKTPLYTVGSTPGINFGELWADYNIWGELQTSGLPSHADGSQIAPGTPYLASPASFSAAFEDPFRKYRQPTRIRHLLAYSLISRPKAGSETNEYDLLLVVDPLVVLWNPFNVPYYLPSSAYTSFQNWSVPYRLSLSIQKSTGAVKGWSANIPQIATTRFNDTRVAKGEPLVMRPGEVQVLSQSYRDQVNASGSIDAKLGWNFGSGFVYSLSVPKTDDTTGETNQNSLNLPIINGDDQITFALTPASGGQSHGLGLTLSRQFIGDEGPYPNGNFSIDWTTVPEGTRNGNLAAQGFPNVFRQIENDASYSRRVDNMIVPVGTSGATTKWPLFLFSMDVRTEQDSYASEIASLSPSTPTPRYTSKALMSFNPKSFAYDLGDLSDEFSRETPVQIGLRKLTSLNNIIDIMGAGQGFFGASHSAGGSPYVVTQSVPRHPILSLGALQNSLADGLMSNTEIASQNSNLSRVWYLRPSISHAIANSFAPAVLPPDQTAITRSQGTKYQRDLADHSFLANRALWDDWFFSSVSPESTTAQHNASQAYAEQKARLAAFFETPGNANAQLPNPRFQPWSRDPEATLEDLFDGKQPRPEAAERIGAHLLVNGAFNVNSTSVAAWKSMLGALKGNDVPVREPRANSKDADLTPTTDTPIAALLIAAGGKIAGSSLSNPADPEQWLGFRSLNDTEIDELAQAIVKQVRLRGPFTSLADFVNRRPGNDSETAVSGALQSALDDPEVSINEEYRHNGRSLTVSEASSQGFAFPEGAAGAKSAGAPGYVKQGDLLTPLGPLIAVRGDTFTVRGYGDSRNNNGQILAKAYCEAVVQRVPEYLDRSDEASDPSPNSPVNQKFGRRFEIVSFRFLNKEEI